MAVSPNPDILRGCDAIVKVDGESIAFATSIKLNENVNQKEIRGIGDFSPKGASAMFWSGTLDMTLHVLTKSTAGAKYFDMSTASKAAQRYQFIFIQKSSETVVATALGHANTRDWNLDIENTSEQNMNFTLVEIEYKDGFR